MKLLLLSIAANISFACFGAGYKKLNPKEQLNERTAMIQVIVPDSSDLHYELAFKTLSSKKMLACLIADTNPNKASKKNASTLLETLARLKLKASLVPNSPTRSASLRNKVAQVISSQNVYSEIAYTTVFIIKNFGDCITSIPRVEVVCASAPMGNFLLKCDSDDFRSAYSSDTYEYHPEPLGTGTEPTGSFPLLSFVVNNSAIYQKFETESCCSIL